MAFIRVRLAGPSRAGRWALVLVWGALGLWGVPAARAQCPSSFAAAVHYAAGTQLYSVAISDLNGDGRLDLAVANFLSSNVSVLLGNGDGTFAAPVNYAAGTNPRTVAIGDVNGDGRPDLAVANQGSANVSVLLGNGNGTFGAPANYAAGGTPRTMAMGDFNGDGWPDLAVANQSGSTSVSVLLGNGPPNTGTFGAAVNYAVGGAPISVAIGDLNGDDRPDLAVTKSGTSNNVSVLLNNAPPNAGTFGAAVNYIAGTDPSSVAIGDLSGDGRPDLAVAYGAGVSVLLGNGPPNTGTFGAAINYAAGAIPRSVTIGDLNGDGRPDLAVANQSSNNVSVLLGNGNGSFGAAVNYAAGGNPWSVANGDFDGDGRTDLAVANFSSNNVSVLLNNGASIGISQQPVGQTVATGQNAALSVTATGATSYRWRRNGVVLSNGGRFGGVTTGTLTISGVLPADAGVYDVQIGTACNAGVTSSPAVLSVRGCNPADIATSGNPSPLSGPDGFLTGDDFDAFIILFFDGC